MNFGQDLLHNDGSACNLQVVDAFGHDAGEFYLLTPTAELGIDLAGNQIAPVAGGHTQLDAESQRCINEPVAWLVAVKNLLGRVEVLEPGTFQSNRMLEAGR